MPQDCVLKIIPNSTSRSNVESLLYLINRVKRVNFEREHVTITRGMRIRHQPYACLSPSNFSSEYIFRSQTNTTSRPDFLQICLLPPASSLHNSKIFTKHHAGLPQVHFLNLLRPSTLKKCRTYIHTTNPASQSSKPPIPSRPVPPAQPRPTAQSDDRPTIRECIHRGRRSLIQMYSLLGAWYEDLETTDSYLLSHHLLLPALWGGTTPRSG